MGVTREASILVDTREAAKMLGVSPHTWLTRVSRGQAPLPHARMGKMGYYRRADIEHFAEHGTWPARMEFKGARVE